MTDKVAEEALAKITEIERLLRNMRETSGPGTLDFIAGLDAGIIIGKLKARLERGEPT